MGAGAILVAGSGLAMAWVAAEGILAAPAIAAPAVALNFGAGLLIPHAQAGVIGPYPHMAGTASALSGAVQMVMAALTAAIVGHLYDGSALPMAIGMAVAGCATLAVHVQARRRAARVSVVAPPPDGSS
jgi:DHA1 family bicyclomycin/chloramphenicol resistance-like MFS transporter